MLGRGVSLRGAGRGVRHSFAIIRICPGVDRFHARRFRTPGDVT